jgi:hypothetical protein
VARNHGETAEVFERLIWGWTVRSFVRRIKDSISASTPPSLAIMTVASIRTALAGRYSPLPLVLFLTIVADGCATTTQREQAATTQISARELAPGIPDLPDLVTVVPFYSKSNETEGEQTKVAIPVEIDGLHGIVILDLGAAFTVLNRTFLQPNSIGGVDSITDDNRIPDHTPWNQIVLDPPREWEKVHVTMRIGTLLVNFEDPDLNNAARVRNPYQYNAVLGHMWDNFGWAFSPRLGNIGTAALQQFETIIDYKNRQVVLIRLDSRGHRMAAVPAYLPRWAAPVVPVKYYEGIHTWGLAVGPQNTLDTLNTANNTMIKVLDTGAPRNEKFGDHELLGYPFLSSLGVFGINQRMQQFFLYF